MSDGRGDMPTGPVEWAGRFEQQAAVMGVNVEVSDWQDDGWVTLSVAPEKVASR